MAHSALDVARWFLQRNKYELDFNDSEYISNLKLQKLLYYAQGCFLAIYNKRLFKENLVAWEHGPVVKKVYQEYQHCGSKGIDSFELPKEEYTEDEKNCLEMVFDEFGKYSAWGLRNMTHEERPWQETKQQYTISTDLIREFFLEEYIENA